MHERILVPLDGSGAAEAVRLPFKLGPSISLLILTSLAESGSLLRRDARIIRKRDIH